MNLFVSVIPFLLLEVVNSQKLAEQKIESYTSCKTDSDCKPNSFCYGNDDNQTGKCKCMDGFELIRNTTYYTCLIGAKLGEACENDKQCQVISSEMAYCNENRICACDEMSQAYTNGVCYLKVKLGETCLTDSNCYLVNNEWGYCTLGKCVCPINKRPSPDNTLCISTKRMGEECIADEECGAIANARCREVCRCAVGYVLSRDGSGCDKAATKFGDNCTEDAQCQEFLKGGLCLNGQCVCTNGYHSFGSRCYRTRKLGEQCEETTECIYEEKLEDNVECQSNKCVCVFGVGNSGACRIEKVKDNNAGFRLSSSLTCLIATLFLFRVVFET